MRKAIVVVAVLVFLAVSAVVVFAAGGIVAQYGWQPYARVHQVADEQLRALKVAIKGQPSNQTFETTNLYRLSLTTSQTSADKVGDKVAFTKLGTGYLVGKRNGELFFVENTLEPMLAPQPIATRVPTNKDQFNEANAHRNPTLMPLLQFGVKDILVRERQGGVELYASYSHWDPDERCATLRVSSLAATPDRLLEGPAGQDWTTVFEAKPCIAPNEELDAQGDFSFLQAGGRLAFLDEGHLLVTVGDHYQDGFAGPDLPQDPESDFGKVVSIDVSSGQSRVFSLGHRNPQGLYVDREKNIWSVEHGPQGGDELNLVEDGANYGWPKVGYGTQYPNLPWPAPDWGNHDAFTLPLYSWVPSVAPCNLIRLEGSSKFPAWEGDIIVGTLKDRSIIRLRVRDGRVVVAEPVAIGNRVRDLDQAEDGSLVLLTDDGDFVTLVPVDAPDTETIDDPVLLGQVLWAQCDACHSLERGANHEQGPNLQGTLGSPIARHDDFSYSKAFGELDGVWTEENLDAFLRNPQAFAPGTLMQFAGIEDDRHRAAIIAYLRSN